MTEKEGVNPQGGKEDEVEENEHSWLFFLTVHDPIASTLITDNSLLRCSNFYISFVFVLLL